jgi:hypothetical protein
MRFTETSCDEQDTEMDLAMTRFAVRAAYGASQLPRVAWYIGHGFVMGRLAERMRQPERQGRDLVLIPTPRAGPHLLYRDMAALSSGISPMWRLASIPFLRTMMVRC